MELLLPAAIVLVFLAVITFVAVKAGAATRAAVTVIAIVGVAIFSFSQGVAYKSVLFYSSYVYWIREYSVHLAELAQENKCEELKRTVTRFDERMRNKPEDAVALEDTMHELLGVGRYYNTAGEPATRPAVGESDGTP
jgi:chromate transport protein ChrA